MEKSDDAPAFGGSERKPRGRRALRVEQLAGPKGLPLVGNVFELDAARLHLVLEDWARKYGGLYGFRAGLKRTLVVSDPTLVEQVLRARPQHYRRIDRIATVTRLAAISGARIDRPLEFLPQRWLSPAQTTEDRSGVQKWFAWPREETAAAVSELVSKGELRLGRAPQRARLSGVARHARSVRKTRGGVKGRFCVTALPSVACQRREQETAEPWRRR